MPGRRPPKALSSDMTREEIRRQQAVSLTAQGLNQRTVARKLGVDPDTVGRDLLKPKSVEELRALRDQIRQLVLERTAKSLMNGALDVAEAAVGDKDAKSLELSTRAAVNLDKLTVSAVGEPQRVDVGGHLNLDIRAILAQAFGAAHVER